MLIALALMAASPAPATPPIIVFGVGNNTCGQWREARREGGDEEVMYKSWLGGFVSGVNDAGRVSDVLVGGGIEDAAKWIDNYCAAQPFDTLKTAAVAMIEARLSTRGR